MADEGSTQRDDERRDEAEAMARLQEQINSLPVSEHVQFMLQSLSSLAVDRLGLVAESAARRDLEQARLAIDAFKALLGVLEEARPVAEMAAHRGVLSQLQLAYVGAMGAPAAEGVDSAEGASATKREPTTKAKPAAKSKPSAKGTAAAKSKPAAKGKPAAKSEPAAKASAGKTGAGKGGSTEGAKKTP